MNVIHENILVKLGEVITEKVGVKIPDGITVGRKGTVVRFGEAIPEEVKVKLTSKPTIEYKEFFDGQKLTIEKEEYIVMNYKDILLIL